jgi:hypothetical protein
MGLETTTFCIRLGATVAAKPGGAPPAPHAHVAAFACWMAGLTERR